MNSRLLAGTAAIILAVLGAMLVHNYAQGADRRAMQNVSPVSVLVVQAPIPAGTPAESLPEFLALEQLPSAAVPASALASLDGQAGKVTTADLVAGEPLLAERLKNPADVATSASVPVPAGLQEVTFALDPVRLVGGHISAGDTVGVFVSYDAGALPERPVDSTTARIAHKVLVTRIQRAPVEATGDAAADASALPNGTMLVTAAVGDAAAARTIYSAEFGRIWLTKEPADAVEDPRTVITKSEAYP